MGLAEFARRAGRAAALGALRLIACLRARSADRRARSPYEPTLATVERRVEAMGTTLDLVVRMKYREAALDGFGVGVAELRRVEALLTTWKPGGELWRVNEGAPGKPRRRLRASSPSCSRDVFAWIRAHRAAPSIRPSLPWCAPGTCAARAASPRPAELAAARRGRRAPSTSALDAAARP